MAEQKPRRFKQIVDDLLRRRAAAHEVEDQGPQHPITLSVDLGTPRLPDIDDVSEALALTEGDERA